MNENFLSSREVIKILLASPKKDLIFDFDKTLVYNFYDWKSFKLDVWNILKNIDNSLIPEDPGAYAMPVINEAIKKHGIEVKKIFDEYVGEFEKTPIKNPLVNEELVDFVIKSKEKEIYRQYIWSNNHSNTVNSILKKLDIAHCFTKVITRDKAYLNKPYPDGFFEIFNKEIHHRNDFILIGDNEDSDGEAARRVGIDYLVLKMDLEKVTKA